MVAFLKLLVISDHLRLDKGTETSQISTIHGFLRKYSTEDGTEEDTEGDTATVHYGPSTNNKVLFLCSGAL